MRQALSLRHATFLSPDYTMYISCSDKSMPLHGSTPGNSRKTMGDGISFTETPANISRTEYYGMDGIRLVTRPRKGLCIRKTFYDNGTTRTDKITVE